jgi:release factor glutamine methyltransferase
MVERRVAGEPLQYVLGHWAFRSLDLIVDRRVLVPRPETEVVVEVALSELDRFMGQQAPRRTHRANGGGAGERSGTEDGPRTVVDLGTGSGAIALSVAAERRSVEVWATDLSAEALAVASANLTGLGARAAGRVRLALGDWWEALPPVLEGRLALAVANPPYVALGELASLPPEVSGWEPLSALVAGPTGLEAIEVLLMGAPRWLAPGAAIVTEIAPHQAERAALVAEEAGLRAVSTKRDLAGKERVLVARRSGS